jgi:hypothetical protein
VHGVTRETSQVMRFRFRCNNRMLLVDNAVHKPQVMGPSANGRSQGTSRKADVFD